MPLPRPLRIISNKSSHRDLYQQSAQPQYRSTLHVDKPRLPFGCVRPCLRTPAGRQYTTYGRRGGPATHRGRWWRGAQRSYYSLAVAAQHSARIFFYVGAGVDRLGSGNVGSTGHSSPHPHTRSPTGTRTDVGSPPQIPATDGRRRTGREVVRLQVGHGDRVQCTETTGAGRAPNSERQECAVVVCRCT